MESKEYFLIDICGTLFRSNTTYDFMHFFFKDEKWFITLSRCRKNKYITFLNAQIQRLFHVDFMRRFLISHLAGYSKEELKKMATMFYDDYLSNVKNEAVFDIIEQKRKEGKSLVIVSATLDCISLIVSQKLNIAQQYSSVLKYDVDGICLGEFEEDLLGVKLKKIKSCGILPKYGGIITDNYSDIDLIEESDCPYLVQYENIKNKWDQIMGDKLNKSEYVFI